MNMSNHCRTCYNNGTNFHSVDEYSINYPQKTLADMLLYVTQIDATNINEKTLPRQICDDCKGQLENAFSFVHKSQHINKRFMVTSKFTPQNQLLPYREDCLTESLIDFPLDNDCQIKIETDLDNMEILNGIFNDISLPAEIESKPVENEENIKKSLSDEGETDPITVQLECKIPTNKLISTKITGNNNCNSKQLKHGKKLQHERFSCDICFKTFAWKKDVQRHALTHNSSPKYKCTNCDRRFLRKDKLKDHMKVHEKQLLLQQHQSSNKTTPQRREWYLANRLYTIQTVYSMQCKLCNTEFKKGNNNKLRQHLLKHNNPGTLDTLDRNSDVIQWFKNKADYLKIVKDLICKDIAEKKLNRYYSIVNEYGYEMELSDNDIVDNTSETTINQYTCELCQAQFSQEYFAVEHAKNMHALDELPYKCSVCKLHFVCNKFYEEHLRTQCQSKDKLYQCPDCLGKFMWLQNLNRHICLDSLKRKKQTQPKQEQQDNNNLRNIKCCLCCVGKFNRLAELRVHLLEHASENLPIQLRECDYYKMYRDDDFMQQSEESIVLDIQRELLSESNMWRFFNAIDSCGHEMDINDSDSDSDSQLQYICTICPPLQCVFSQRKYLLQHQRNEHASSNTTPLPFKCIVCQEEFIAAALLERHKVRDCQKQIIKRYTCNECSTSFIWENNLKLHSKFCCTTTTQTKSVNEQEYKNKKNIKCQETSKKLQCEECEKIFIWPKDLIRHKRIHLPEHKKLQCPHCERRFNRTDNLRRHLKVHTDKTAANAVLLKDEKGYSSSKNPTANERHDEKFECLECSRTFMLQRDLSRHSVMHNREAAIHKCLWCGRKFYNKENLLIHIERHGIVASQWETARCIVDSNNQPHGIKRLLCKLCTSEEAFLSISELRAHLENQLLANDNDAKTIDLCRNYSIINSHGCELDINDSETDGECEKNFNNKNAFVYICEICGINCRRKYEVMQHQLTLHKWENLPYNCERCIFRTVCKDILTHHMRTQCFNTEKQYNCEICNLRFMWRENLEEHKIKMHVNMKGVISNEEELNCTKLKLLSSANEKFFQCLTCKDKFSRKKSLVAHIAKKHGTTTNTSTKTIEKEATAKFLCAFCGRALSSSSNLIIHMRRHTGEKPFKCKFCEKAFPRSSDMVCHQRTHTGERPHKCTVCHKAFSRMYKLRTHMRIHSGERPYKCTFCEKSFTQSNDLALHIRRHTGERPYVCGICGEGFIQSTALKNHRNLKSHFEDNVPRRGNYLERIDSNNICNY